MVGINALANILPIGGRTTGGVSEFVDNIFVPAGFTFSIWGVIYSLLAFFVIMAFIKRKEQPYKEAISSIGYLFLINSLLNATWIFAWHNLYIGISMILMIGLLATLLMIYLKLQKINFESNSLASWSMRIPFRVYAGWISVATIANMAAMLTFYDFDGFGIDPQLWAMTMISIATVLGVLMLFKFDDFAFSTVVAWALYGIYSKRVAVVNIDDSILERGALIMLTVVLLSMALKFLRKKV